MDSKTSKTKCPTSVEAEAAIVPGIPQEIIDEILDHLAIDSDSRSLRSCALVSKSWVPSSRRHLFHTVTFTPGAFPKWLKTFPVPGESPAHHVRDLIFSPWGQSAVPPKKLLEYIPWFTNVEKMSLSDVEVQSLLEAPSSWKLPQSVTSLTISTIIVDLSQIRDIMLQLPNLDNLSLLGPTRVVRGTIQGMGAALSGSFCGKLRLLDGCAHEDVMNMLLEVPTGLRFAEVQIRGWNIRLLSAVRLVEACSKALVKLSYNVTGNGKSHPAP